MRCGLASMIGATAATRALIGRVKCTRPNKSLAGQHECTLNGHMHRRPLPNPTLCGQAAPLTSLRC